MKLDSNTVCIVTGGVSGLGLAAVKKLLESNCKIIVGDINPDGQTILDEISKDIFFVKTDVSDENSIKELVDKTVKKFGAIHVVVNCAGIIIEEPFIAGNSYAKTSNYEKLFRIHVLGTFNLCKYAAGQMMKQPELNEFKEKGVLINISSAAAYEGMGRLLMYSGVKGAIIGMALPMARDLGKYGVRVCTVAPGFFETPMTFSFPDKFANILKGQLALNRFGDPKEFGDIVVSLCNNSYMTGNVVIISGGMIAPHL